MVWVAGGGNAKKTIAYGAGGNFLIDRLCVMHKKPTGLTSQKFISEITCLEIFCFKK